MRSLKHTRKIYEFGSMDKCKETIMKNWAEFRDALNKGSFKYDDIDKAKTYKFLKIYDDVFNKNSGIAYKTVKIKDYNKKNIGRGTILSNNEELNYERFIPKKEYIKENNRFSPKGIEWLYLATGDKEDEVYQCAKDECRVKIGDRFGFCNFGFDTQYDDLKLVDLTIADKSSYWKLNCKLENKGYNNSKEFVEWSIKTYSKLLSEQIFLPLKSTENKGMVYTPFQTMAQYYIHLGYSGIIFKSTVCNIGKNIVLFEKNIAFPIGEIKEEIIF